MTTKTYNLIESDQNGDQLEVKSYDTRFEAVQAMATRLMADDTTQPQNFRIEEAYQVDEEATLMDAAAKIAKALEVFCYRSEIKPYFSDDSGFVELRNKAQSLTMSNIVLKHLFATVNEVNAGLPEGHEVEFIISKNLNISIFMSNN